MAHTSAVTEIGKVVDKYLLKYALPQENYFTYLQHACDCFREINLRHSNNVVTTKIAVSVLGIIDMPSDMIGFGHVFIPINGEWWSFTKKPRKVTTTTSAVMTTATMPTIENGEGQDSEYGEGVDVQNDVYYGLGGKGGVNDYYFTIDWSARRIFCDGFKSDIAILQYMSSGLVVSGSTFVPGECETVIDAYLNWKKEMIAPRSMSMIQYLEKLYTDQIKAIRLIHFMPSKDEICDAWDSSSSQGIQR